MVSFTAFITSFLLIAFAELGDKTQLIVFCLASRFNNRFQVMAGVMIAFFLVDGLAVLLGDVIVQSVPEIYIKLISSALFIGFGIYLFIHKDEMEDDTCEVSEQKTRFTALKPFITAFSLIFVCEMGDKTQLTTGLLAANFKAPLEVFCGALGGLFIVSVIALFAGEKIKKYISPKTLHTVAAISFIALGMLAYFF